jgi:hypothetical protein
MKLYAWDSSAFADFGLGKIIVMAEDIETARQKVFSKYGDNSSEGYYKKLMVDISDKPDIITDGVFVEIKRQYDREYDGIY